MFNFSNAPLLYPLQCHPRLFSCWRLFVAAGELLVRHVTDILLSIFFCFRFRFRFFSLRLFFHSFFCFLFLSLWSGRERYLSSFDTILAFPDMVWYNIYTWTCSRQNISLSKLNSHAMFICHISMRHSQLFIFYGSFKHSFI